jgi:pimeloyl-ACP methyl ester carboxylesterase
MEIEHVSANGSTLAIHRIGKDDQRSPELVWGHGWGQSSEQLLPLAESLTPFAPSVLVDFPGFGETPAPPLTWGTADYADAAAAWLSGLPKRPRIWVAHSFGCRVGLQLASRRPDLVSAMVLIAAAGLRRRRSLVERTRLRLRIAAFKTAGRFASESARERLRARFGSADYLSAGVLRPILTRVVNEDLSQVAVGVKAPTLLIYGSRDQDTPPDIGQRLSALIPGARLLILDGFDHHTILSQGRHQVVHQVHRVLESVSR